MGGLGSGRRWWVGSKDTTEDYRQIDVRRWHREGYLTQGRSFGWQWSRDGQVQASIQVRAAEDHIVLTYRHCTGGSSWKDEEYPVRLAWTPCSLGGRRPWFICPVRGCGRRVAILYCGGIFACRHCYRLAYASQREMTFDRAIRRADSIRDRLGWERGLLAPNGDKPKGMRWRTYLHLLQEHERWSSLALAAMMQGLEGLQKHIDALAESDE